ncbi:F-box/FBD/LRR-repeat protein At1g13570 [Medicago truncatula]|uniref:F-box/FBD/LRR-repeat protein At1g13570 n=1 Tax=Medicago truncatula TaxID=3880 RepID=UPI00196898FB|nr:F-box/FBD/LRR-repeat protein At1g13570 [Medicago truncatula]
MFSNFLITNEYLNKWILFLSRRGIKNIVLLNCGTFNRLPHMKMPFFVFSCQELTHFRLSGFNLSVPPNFDGLKSLRVLHLGCNRYELGSLESLIAGCPLLEELNIIFPPDAKSICLKNAKNLIDLSLTVNQDRVSGLIKSLPKIQRLDIESYGNKLYADIIHPSQLISLKYLELFTLNMNDRGEVLYIVSVLKSASNLVELTIQSNNYDGVEEPNQSEELECNSCCLSQLQTVRIRVGGRFKNAMSLIRFILANSSSLKTLTFKVGFGIRILMQQFC